MIIHTCTVCMFYIGILIWFLSCISSSVHSSSYSDTEARKLLKLSAGAYGTPYNQESCASRLFTNGSFNILSSFEVPCDALHHNCYGYVLDVPSKQRVYLIFSGTRELLQVILEGFSALTPQTDFYGMGKVNGYFAEAHERLWMNIRRFMVKTEYQNSTFVFSGHSLGGSLATLAAARCAQLGFCKRDQTVLYTFGEPRTGTVKFAKNFDRMIGENYRVVHQYDPITQFPFCKKNLGIISLVVASACDSSQPSNPYHHGSQIWYENDMSSANYKICDEVTQPNNCPTTINPLRIGQQILDHRDYFNIPVPHYGMSGCLA